MFWTLDINGTRYIVKPFNGQAQGGMRYLYWAGPGKGFEQKPLALSFISPSQAGATISANEDGNLLDRSSFAPVNRKRSVHFDSSESSDSSDTSDSEVEEKRRRTPGLTQCVANGRPEGPSQRIDDNDSDHHSSETNALKQPVAFQSVAAKRRKTEVSSREIDQLYRVSPPARRRSDAGAPSKEHEPEPEQPTTSTPKKVNEREEKRKQRATAQIEKDLDRKFDQIFTPWAGEDQVVSRNTLQIILKIISLMKENSPQMICRTLNKALNGGDGKRQPAGGRKPTRPCFTELVASLQGAKDASVNGGGLETSSSGSSHQQPESKGLQEPEAVSVNSVRPEAQTIPSDGDRHQLVRNLDLDILPPMVLPPQKQTRTTLIIRVAPSLEYMPLKLSECMTPPTFYTKVLGAWEIRKDSVANMTLTFTWMDPEDPMRTMAMNSQIESCFAHLIEQVDEAPSWVEAPEGKGKCILNVEIVLKE